MIKSRVNQLIECFVSSGHAHGHEGYRVRTVHGALQNMTKENSQYEMSSVYFMKFEFPATNLMSANL